ncbi:hypothetical protein DZF91_03335 [Actinomadura logoneensis]|uniref:Uncharacterized protein n=1 Tax=Actinomadura logoneensis TaxID=2293572 RepID=A0A372JSV6_9ACTN|nr:hypothetical protein [Actinomadura logoneensis]RFU43029.1 hypothetical protein DZF91_03335 [Actinomadura logoneensis]
MTDPTAPPPPPPGPETADAASPAGSSAPFPPSDAPAAAPPPPPASAPAEEVRPGKTSIGIWGAPQSGKTTFLAALRIAMSLGEPGWRLDGANDGSTAFLAASTDQLSEQRVFPSATNSSEKLSWRLHGTRQVRERRKWYRPDAKRDVPVRVHLDFVDPPGRLFDSRAPGESASPGGGAGAGSSGGPRFATGSSGSGGPRFATGSSDSGGPRFATGSSDSGGPRFATGAPPEPSRRGEPGGRDRRELVEHLAACGGLILLLDPTREREARDSYQFFNRTILEISQRAPESAGDHYLPHHLAVCITKYDHLWVRDIARRGGYESVADPESLYPAVHDDLAERFFEELCRADGIGNIDAIRREIRQHFAPERTRYFVTSAVGFYIDPRTGRFDDENYSNLVRRTHPDGSTSMHLRGKVRPINVMEPIMWLVDRLSAPSAGAGGTRRGRSGSGA